MSSKVTKSAVNQNHLRSNNKVRQSTSVSSTGITTRYFLFWSPNFQSNYKVLEDCKMALQSSRLQSIFHVFAVGPSSSLNQKREVACKRRFLSPMPHVQYRCESSTHSLSMTTSHLIHHAKLQTHQSCITCILKGKLTQAFIVFMEHTEHHGLLVIKSHTTDFFTLDQIIDSKVNFAQLT